MKRTKTKLRLYDIGACVQYHSVILAAHEKDALEHVATWEQAWHENADLISVNQVEITDIRLPGSSEWTDEAHDRTVSAMKAQSNLK